MTHSLPSTTPPLESAPTPRSQPRCRTSTATSGFTAWHACVAIRDSPLEAPTRPIAAFNRRESPLPHRVKSRLPTRRNAHLPCTCHSLSPPCRTTRPLRSLQSTHTDSAAHASRVANTPPQVHAGVASSVLLAAHSDRPRPTPAASVRPLLVPPKSRVKSSALRQVDATRCSRRPVRADPCREHTSEPRRYSHA
ncbi:hypothetical protein C8R43DRAFT_1137413 [Mycena crocata]|nr:hypothetical protein C8R43DRAFT_1137413 [Mycena crocata]